MSAPDRRSAVRMAVDSVRKAGWMGALLAAATVFFAARYGTAFYLFVLSSDFLQPVNFIQDIVVHARSPHDWVWCSTPYTFPDFAVLFPLNALLRDGVAALQAYTALLFLGFYAFTFLIYRECGGRHLPVFSALLLAVLVGFMTNFGFPRIGIPEAFRVIECLTPFTHTGASLSSLICLYLLLRFLRRRSPASLGLLGIVMFLGGISDASSLLSFSLPCAAALAVGAFWYPDRARTLAGLAAGVLACGIATYFLSPRLFPAVLVRDGFTRLHPSAIVPALRVLLEYVRPSHGLLFPAFLLLDLLLVLGVGIHLAGLCRGRKDRLPMGSFLLLASAAFMVVITWSATIVTGNLTVPFSVVRYYAFPLMAPLFLLAGYAAHAVPWHRAASGIVIVASSLLAFVVAAFFPPQPSPGYREAKRLIPVLHELMAREGIRYGLAEYWHAVPITYLSDDTVIVRPVYSGGTLPSLLNNVKWYAGDVPGHSPDFNLVLMKSLDPRDIRLHYGAPTKIVSVGEDGEAWLYLGDDAIGFCGFLQDFLPKKRFSTDAATWTANDLPSQTGTPEGGSRVAAEGRDKAGYLLFGPYSQPLAGTYRIDLAYAYPVPPPAGKEAGIDIVGDNVPPHFTPLRVLGQGKLPAAGDSGPPFTRTLYIPAGLRIQVRIFYPGAGTLRVDSLKITHVGP